MSFPVFRHFGDVTVGGRSVGSTSGFEFLVRAEINRSMCSGVLLVFVYFRFGDVTEIAKKSSEVWRAILSEPL